MFLGYVSYFCLHLCLLFSLDVEYFQRLFLLDLHIKHFQSLSFDQLGIWLARRWVKCQGMKAEAKESLQSLGIPTATLREQWAQQVSAQTKPAPRMFIFLYYTVLMS